LVLLWFGALVRPPGRTVRRRARPAPAFQDDDVAAQQDDLARAARGSQNVEDTFENFAVGWREVGILQAVLDPQFESVRRRMFLERDEGAAVGQGDEIHADPPLQRAARIDDDDRTAAEGRELGGRVMGPNVRLGDTDDGAAQVAVECGQRFDGFDRERQRDRA
jgi:hypothetical protein